MNPKTLTEINENAASIAASIHVLRPLSWPLQAGTSFLEKWNQGQRELPKIEKPNVNYAEQIEKLEDLKNSFTADHPLEIYTKKTIEGYLLGAQLVMANGTPEFQQLSSRIYGTPSAKMPGIETTNLEAAYRIIEIVDRFQHPFIGEPEICVTAQQMKDYLESQIRSCFGQGGPAVTLVDQLPAKATASSKTVKLRNATCYSQYDYDQLNVHEVMTHSLTALNGQQQPILKLLARGGPRTTSAQEGLATFSEVITGSIDLRRLKRIALRIIAIEKALQGADFIEVFSFFLFNIDSAVFTIFG